MKSYPKWLYRGPTHTGLIVSDESEHATKARDGYIEEPQEKAPIQEAEPVKRKPGRPRKDQA